jgi:hypothetical protein
MNPPVLSNSDLEMNLRKSYIKPRIERVSLVPEETVLGGCKLSQSSGPLGECLPIGGLPCDRVVDVS